MVVPRFIQSALRNEEICIYGDGSQSRVFCHVEDAVRAVIALAQEDLSIGDYFNVGGIGEVTINQFAEKVVKITKSNSAIKHIPYSEIYLSGFEDMQRRVPAIEKISKIIGWVPSHNLDSIISSVALSLME